MTDERFRRYTDGEPPGPASSVARGGGAYHTHKPAQGGPAKYLNLPEIDTAGAQRAKWINGHLRQPKPQSGSKSAAPHGAQPTRDAPVLLPPPVPRPMSGGLGLYDAICSQAMADALTAELEESCSPPSRLATLGGSMRSLGGQSDPTGGEHARCDAVPRALLALIGGTCLAEWALGPGPKGPRQAARLPGAEWEPGGDDGTHA